MEPYVRLMLYCEELRRRDNPRRFDALGLFTTARPITSEFPLQLSFAVLLLLTEGRGEGNGQVFVVDADTEEEIYESNVVRVRFGGDPTQVTSVRFRVDSCTFKKPGLYNVEFRYNGNGISSQPLLIKDP
jgi:hypothetical protein